MIPYHLRSSPTSVLPWCSRPRWPGAQARDLDVTHEPSPFSSHTQSLNKTCAFRLLRVCRNLPVFIPSASWPLGCLPAGLVRSLLQSSLYRPPTLSTLPSSLFILSRQSRPSKTLIQPCRFFRWPPPSPSGSCPSRCFQVRGGTKQTKNNNNNKQTC